MTHERRHRIGSQRAWPVFLGFCLLISLGCSQSTKRKAIEGTVTQILPPLDFLAEFTQHIPAKGSHLIRYYGWYSNKSRGTRKKAEVEASAEPSSEDASVAAPARCSQTWAMLIKRALSTNNPAKWTPCVVHSAAAR